MDNKVTISVRGLVVTAAVLLALAAAYVLGAGGKVGEPARAADDAVDTTKRVLTMAGTGEATAVPDQVSFRLSVSAKRSDLDSALAEANRLMRKALHALSEQGVAKEDVQTTGLQMNPEYQYHSYDPPTLTGYRVTQTARVLVKELAKAGRAIGATVSAGDSGVRVSGIQLEIGDPQAAMAQARAAAVAEATAKAQQYAEETGQSLGQVVDLREVSATRPRDLYYGRVASQAMYGLTDAAAVLPIRAGEDELKVTVKIVWSFG